MVDFLPKGRPQDQNSTLCISSRKSCQTRAGEYIGPGEPDPRAATSGRRLIQLINPLGTALFNRTVTPVTAVAGDAGAL